MQSVVTLFRKKEKGKVGIERLKVQERKEQLFSPQLLKTGVGVIDLTLLKTGVGVIDLTLLKTGVGVIDLTPTRTTGQ